MEFSRHIDINIGRAKNFPAIRAAAGQFKGLLQIEQAVFIRDFFPGRDVVDGDFEVTAGAYFIAVTAMVHIAGMGPSSECVPPLIDMRVLVCQDFMGFSGRLSKISGVISVSRASFT